MGVAAPANPLDDNAADRRRHPGGHRRLLPQPGGVVRLLRPLLLLALLRRVLLPSGDRTTQLLNAAGVFAAGFLVRPLGGWVFGRPADRRGWRFAMMTSVLLSAAAA